MKSLKLVLALTLFISMSFFGGHQEKMSDILEVVTIERKSDLLIKQKGQFWCWAAVAEGINNYFGVHKPQEEIVKAQFNITHLSPDDYTSEFRSLNLVYFDSYREENLQSNEFVSREISKVEIVDNLKSGNPVVVMANSHVYIAVGYKTNLRGDVFLEVMDPYFANADFYWQDIDNLSFLTMYMPAIYFTVERIKYESNIAQK